MDRIVHSVTPLAVIAAATVLVALRRIDSGTGIALIVSAGAGGAVAVGVANRRP